MNIRAASFGIIAAWLFGASATFAQKESAQSPPVTPVERPYNLLGNWSIVSGHMAPTFLLGDRVHVEQHILGKDSYEPRRGDVILVQHTYIPKHVMFGRIVGLPGDRAQMKAGRLYLSGVQVDRKLVRRFRYIDFDLPRVVDATEYEEQLPGEPKAHLIHEWRDDDRLDNTPEFKVPAGHLFLMGDNRDNAEDSRAPAEHVELARQQYDRERRGEISPSDRWVNLRVFDNYAIGFVPFDHVIGRATGIPFSLYACLARRLDPVPPDAVCLKSNVGKPL